MPIPSGTPLDTATNMEAIPIFISLVIFSMCASYALVAGQAQTFAGGGGIGNGSSPNMDETTTTTTTTTTTSTTKAPATTHGLL
uniref:TIL domain containing protein n=1 Tax=Rhipicephalus zambeziensis TaxID=60191 RepID=A0A224YHJ5_9ACAR